MKHPLSRFAHVQPPEAAALRCRPSLRRQAWSRGTQPPFSLCEKRNDSLAAGRPLLAVSGECGLRYAHAEGTKL